MTTDETTTNVGDIQEPTVTLDDVNEQLEQVEEIEPEDKPKLFTQEELETQIQKRIGRERRKLERKYSNNAVPKTSESVLNPDDFSSNEDYIEARIELEAQKKADQKEADNKNKELIQQHKRRMSEVESKYSDFNQVVGNEDLVVTNVMFEEIITSDVGPEIAYYLGKNIEESERIAELSTRQQIKEIAKIELKLNTTPSPKKTTTAPSPIVPVIPRNSGNSSYSTSDPRSTKSMTTSEWIEKRRRERYESLKTK